MHRRRVGRDDGVAEVGADHLGGSPHYPILAAAALLAACSPAPCVSCLTVRGAYSETLHGANIACGDGHYLGIGDCKGHVTLGQSGSALTSGAIFNLSGVLHADGSASFGPGTATAEPMDGDGNPDPSGQPVHGKVYLHGWFTLTPASFEGIYTFIADNDGCELDVRVRGAVKGTWLAPPSRVDSPRELTGGDNHEVLAEALFVSLRLAARARPHRVWRVGGLRHWLDRLRPASLRCSIEAGARRYPARLVPPGSPCGIRGSNINIACNRVPIGTDCPASYTPKTLDAF